MGADCNLSCRYCYYLKKAELFEHTGLFRMQDEILEKYIIRQIEATSEQVINFSWHGVEPTLAGLDFFRKVVNLQRKHRQSGSTIINGIQTNATVMNKD